MTANKEGAKAPDYSPDAPDYKVVCPGTRRDCNWQGDIKDCRRVHDNTLSGWICYWMCPQCGSKIAEITNNTSLNHHLQPYSRMSHHGGYCLI